MRRNFPSAFLKNMLLLSALKTFLTLTPPLQPTEPQPRAVKTPESLKGNIKTG